LLVNKREEARFNDIASKHQLIFVPRCGGNHFVLEIAARIAVSENAAGAGLQPSESGEFTFSSLLSTLGGVQFSSSFRMIHSNHLSAEEGFPSFLFFLKSQKRVVPS
jgi:hypothetical protein